MFDFSHAQRVFEDNAPLLEGFLDLLLDPDVVEALIAVAKLEELTQPVSGFGRGTQGDPTIPADVAVRLFISSLTHQSPISVPSGSRRVVHHFTSFVFTVDYARQADPMIVPQHLVPSDPLLDILALLANDLLEAPPVDGWLTNAQN